MEPPDDGTFEAGRNSPLFDYLRRAASAELREDFERREVSQGETLFHEGTPADFIYLNFRGNVKLTRTAVGREHIVFLVGPGETFGDLSLFDPGLRTSTATATTDLVVGVLHHEPVREWLAVRPEVTMHLLTMFVRRLRNSFNDRSDMVFYDVTGRVAQMLLSLEEQFGNPGRPGESVQHWLSHGEIAQRVGASRERVSRVLSTFADRGLIRLQVKAFQILDHDKLAAQAR